jgi:6-pyruvoyltetrahydropterin/6-carboxytetrahydropterin synthase
MKVRVSRKAHFNAAHRLNNLDWSVEQNQRVFGKCNNPNGHGHNYEVIAHVIGEIDQESGYVMDMKDLKQFMREEIEDRYDHKNLNLDVPEFMDLNPTAENMVVVIWNRLRKRIDNKHQLVVTLYETERNYVEYSGN